MKFVEPSFAWRTAFQDMARECEATGLHRYGLALRDFHAYLWRVEENRRGERLVDERGPELEFWLEERHAIVGCARLRLTLTPELEKEGGHIGYDVRPSMRRQGYGTALLGLTLLEARSRGIQRARITCDVDNEGSSKVIERNGGKLAGMAQSPESGNTVKQYWIEL